MTVLVVVDPGRSIRLGVDKPRRLRFFSTAVFTIGDHLNAVKTGEIEYVGQMDNTRSEPIKLQHACWSSKSHLNENSRGSTYGKSMIRGVPH